MPDALSAHGKKYYSHLDNCFLFKEENIHEIVDSLIQSNKQDILVFVDVFAIFSGDIAKNNIFQFFDRFSEDNVIFNTTALSLWKLGISIKLEKLSSSNHRIALPTYPFARIKHWIDRKSINSNNIDKKCNTQAQAVKTTVLEIWQEVFETDKLTYEDEFYAIGGHSLIALQIASRINEKFSINIELSDILNGINIENFCNIVVSKFSASKSDQYSDINDLISHAVSSAEQKMWLLDTLYPTSGICSVPVALRLGNTIMVASLNKALAHLVAKHEILRTSFTLQENSVVRQISNKVDIAVQELYLREEENLQDVFRRLALVKFDLNTPPLLRVTLINTAEDSQVILFVFHHIIIDSWSVGIILNNLSHLYTQVNQNKDMDLEVSAIDYSHFIRRQKDFIENGYFTEQKQYWAVKLANLNQAYYIGDHRFTELQNNGDTKAHTIILNSTCTSNVIKFAKYYNCTIFTVLLSAYKALILLYTNNKDIAVITPFVNRPKKEFENIVGLFANFVILRSDLSKISNFYQLVTLIKNNILEAHDNSEFPFEEVLAANNIDISSLFMFVMHEEKIPKNTIFQTQITERFILSPPTTPTPMSLEVILRSGHLTLNFIYSNTFIKRKLVEQFTENYVKILEECIAQPQNPIEFTKYLASPDLEYCVNDITYPLNQNLYNLFQEIVSTNPHQLAIIESSSAEYTFFNVHQKIGQISTVLNLSGVKKGDIVGVCMEPSMDFVASILSILKVGGIYLPLDTSYPYMRLQYYIDNSEAQCVLTKSSSDTTAQNLNIKNLIDIDALDIAYDDILSSDSHTSANQVACIFYTSGSTGDPKGVMIKHSNIINRCYWFKDSFMLSTEEIFCLSTTINFVDSIAEIFVPLILGSKLYIPSKHNNFSINSFVEEIHKRRVTHLVVVPSFLKLILDTENVQRSLTHIRRIVCSGDILTHDVAKQCLSLGLDLKLYNYYGSTEVTADATYYEVTIDSLALYQDISIGTEISNVKIIILNDDLEPVPYNTLGTIYIGGLCVAAGYWKDEEFTKIKFVSLVIKGCNYFLFNTGDRGYRLNTGEIFYVGRNDAVVNIHGNRINLLEIEKILKKHPYTQDSVVLSMTENDSNVLVAFIVLTQNIQDVSLHEIKSDIIQHLSEFLPRYMVPSVYKFINSIPLTQNGKTDKITLKKLNNIKDNTTGDQIFVPKDSIEEFVQKQFLDLLDIQTINVQDDLFYLGGTSILLIKLISRIENVFKIKATISEILNNPTISTIAKMIKTNTTVVSTSDMIFKISDDKNYANTIIFFHPITGFSYEYTKLKNFLYGYNTYCINYPYVDLQGSCIDSVESMIRFYMSHMIDIIQKSQNITLIGYSFGGVLAVEAARYLSSINVTIDRIVMIDSYFPTEIIKQKSLIENEIKNIIQNIKFETLGITEDQVIGVMNKNYELLVKYKIPKLDSKIFLLKTEIYPEMHVKLWRENFSSQFISIVTPGNHYTLMQEENAQVLGQKIEKLLKDGNGYYDR